MIVFPRQMQKRLLKQRQPFFPIPIGLTSWISWLDLVQSLKFKFHFSDKMKFLQERLHVHYLIVMSITINTCLRWTLIPFDMIQRSVVTVKDDCAKFVGSIKPRAITKREEEIPLPSSFLFQQTTQRRLWLDSAWGFCLSQQEPSSLAGLLGPFLTSKVIQRKTSTTI